MHAKWVWNKHDEGIKISSLDCKSNKQRMISLSTKASTTRIYKNRFGMEHVKKVDIPMGTSTKLDMDENSKNVDITNYWCMIGSLLYLTASKLDFMFIVYLCACFQAWPKESHVSAAKCIFWYLHGKSTWGCGIRKDASII